ncbi:ribbon-helix-helix protein, CopG family [Actinobacillus minor]|uniref:ribbon-helix-helix protein, CopG family n=1 Tax=Actinobacillus minor TaxID=51047 RepID=UPI0026F374AF|nr:ribbon-helix-helix protein, CopG family [Actinobacillus minor]
MAMSRNEIQAKSEAKRGIKAKSFKLPVAFIAEIEALSERLCIPQNQLIIQAVEEFKQKHQ